MLALIRLLTLIVCATEDVKATAHHGALMRGDDMR